MTEIRKVCVCHGELTYTRKGKDICPVTHTPTMTEKKRMKTSLEDTWDGSEIECPEELEEACEDYKEKQFKDD